MPIDYPLAATPAAGAPVLLLDAVEFGFTADFIGFSEPDLRRFSATLRHRGLLADAPHTKRDPCHMVLKVPVPGATNRASGTVRAELFFRSDEQGRLTLTNRSTIRLNLMKLLRAHLGGAVRCGPGGLDGNDNVAGPTVGRADALLAIQLRIAEAAVEAATDAISGALPERAAAPVQALRLRSAEGCLDLPSEDAQRETRILQHTALAGTVAHLRDCYRAGAVDEAGVPAVRWLRDRGGPVMKAYAKRRDLLRLEVACTDREAVAALVGRLASEEVSGGAAAAQLRSFAGAAEPLLTQLVAHAEEALAATASAAEIFLLVRQLVPLADLAEGRRAARGPAATDRSRTAAGDALDALLSTGVYHALGIPTGHAVRIILEQLSRPGGPLVRGGRSAAYALRPRFARAASVMHGRAAA